jgi:hypothetical protein
MATIVFSAIGTLVGGPIGGAVGALVGRQVDAAIIGTPNREGPRLKELSVTTSSYGTAVPRHFGTMRVPGTIIWATDLVEHSETQGGGKNRPSVTTYTYTASFAVALASRPIQGIGRIWADGNLLRGAAGDLKPGGEMRLYTGHGDQPIDPLIAQAEGLDRSPAYRGLAYVVFEDLELADFFNRIPALTFEVFADDSFSLQHIVGEVVPGADADLALDGLEGFSCEGALVDALRQLDPIFPLDTDASGEFLLIARERLQTAPYHLPEAAVSVADEDFGGPSGYARKRSQVRERPPEALRYYDTGRDFLPGLQRSTGRAGPGQPGTIELPASLSAANARALIEKTAHRADWSRDRVAWRTSELDLEVSPGALVKLPDLAGSWRVKDWEWRESGVELSLERALPASAATSPGGATDPGRANSPLDLPAPVTSLIAYELPWDGIGSGDSRAVFAAVSSAGSNWAGAALFVDHGEGQLVPLGPSGRTRSVVGTALGELADGSPLLFDRTSSVVVELLADDMPLTDASPRQLAWGANRALIGSEIVQFANAVPLGDRQWRLENLLRGRGGTERATAGHAAGEDFVLLDSRPVLLDPAIVGSAPETRIAAAGRGDELPVESGIAMQGITLRPLFPVRPRKADLPGGSLRLCWTRRARGAWDWPDGVDAPLHEQVEAYRVTYGPLGAPLATWIVSEPELVLSQQDQVDLVSQLPGGDLLVRQQGSYGLSDPLFLATLT